MHYDYSVLQVAYLVPIDGCVRLMFVILTHLSCGNVDVAVLAGSNVNSYAYYAPV